MLMFDNAIFASLIPQFLMVLGFLSCIVSPFFVSDSGAADNPASIIFEQNAIAYQGGEHANQSSTYIFDCKQVKKIIVSIREFTGNYFTIQTSEIIYPTYVIHFKNVDFRTFLFSRPPPAV